MQIQMNACLSMKCTVLYPCSGLFSDSFSFRYSNPDRSKSMLAVFGSEPESVFVVTANGLFTKLSIDADKGLVQYQATDLRFS